MPNLAACVSKEYESHQARQTTRIDHTLPCIQQQPCQKGNASTRAFSHALSLGLPSQVCCCWAAGTLFPQRSCFPPSPRYLFAQGLDTMIVWFKPVACAVQMPLQHQHQDSKHIVDRRSQHHQPPTDEELTRQAPHKAKQATHHMHVHRTHSHASPSPPHHATAPAIRSRNSKAPVQGHERKPELPDHDSLSLPSRLLPKGC